MGFKKYGSAEDKGVKQNELDLGRESLINGAPKQEIGLWHSDEGCARDQ